MSDALLELGHPLGLRLRTTARGDSDERRWLAHLEPAFAAAELEAHWQGGVVEHAVLRGGPRAIRSFAGHALLHLVRKIDLVAWDAPAVLSSLAAGQLPWLEQLCIHHLEPAQRRALEREFRDLRPAFPRLRALTLLRRARLGLEGNGKVAELDPTRTLSLQDALPNEDGVRLTKRFVRWFERAGWSLPALGLQGGQLELNGNPYQKPASEGRWLIPLKAGDQFVIDGVKRQLVQL